MCETTHVCVHVFVYVYVCVKPAGSGTAARQGDHFQPTGHLTDLLRVDVSTRPQSRGDLLQLILLKYFKAFIKQDWSSKIRLHVWVGEKQGLENHSYDMITEIIVKILQFSSNFKILLIHTGTLLAEKTQIFVTF